MSREIKFRAWDKERKSMHYNAVWIASDTQTLGWGDGHCYTFDRVIPMQYTGLKDKNGKEIYEGDIVKSSSTDDLISEVYWRDEVAGFEFVALDKSGWSWMPNIDAVGSYWEVIGNIYENPELLK